MLLFERVYWYDTAHLLIHVPINSETDLTASVLKKDQKHIKGSKERAVVGQNKTKCETF